MLRKRQRVPEARIRALELMSREGQQVLACLRPLELLVSMRQQLSRRCQQVRLSRRGQQVLRAHIRTLELLSRNKQQVREPRADSVV